MERTMNVSLKSSAIRCGGCANSVRSVLSKSAGVRKVEVDATTKFVEVEFDEQATSAASIEGQLADGGYPVDVPTPKRGLCR
jgi:copper chaperone CopZ